MCMIKMNKIAFHVHFNNATLLWIPTIGEKPYECEFCGRVFSQSASRNTHKRRHHGTLTDSKISPILDGDNDVVNEKLVSKGRGSSHTNKKSRFSIGMFRVKRLCFSLWMHSSARKRAYEKGGGEMFVVLRADNLVLRFYFSSIEIFLCKF